MNKWKTADRCVWMRVRPQYTELIPAVIVAPWNPDTKKIIIKYFVSDWSNHLRDVSADELFDYEERRDGKFPMEG